MQSVLQKLIQRVPGLEARLNQMNSREKTLVSVAAALLLITLVYFVVWKPVTDGISERQATIAAQQELLQWVRENTGVYVARSQASAQPATNSKMAGSVSERVTQLASAAKIELTRMQPQADGLLVVIDQVPFNALLAFVENLQRDAGLTVSHLDATEGSAAGTVRVRRLQVHE